MTQQGRLPRHRLTPGVPRQHDRHHGAFPPAAGDRHPREQPVDQSHRGGRIPLLARLGHLFVKRFEGEHIAQVRTQRIEGHAIAVIGEEDRVGMKGREVVALEVAVEGHLPVRPAEFLGGEVSALAQLESLEIGQRVAEPRIDFHRQTCRKAHEHDARSLLTGQLDQAMRLAIDISEGALLRDTEKSAIGAVGPPVIAAAESSRIAAATRHQLHRAMSAHIDHCLHDSVGATNHHDLSPAHPHGLVVAGLGQLSRHHHRQGNASEDGLHLLLPQALVKVIGDGNAHLVGRHIGGAIAKVCREPVEYRQSFVSIHGVMSTGLVLRNCVGHGSPPRLPSSSECQARDDDAH